MSIKALLLNGERSDAESLARFAGITEERLHRFRCDVNHIVLHRKDIAECTGCFNCWLKTPGVCSIDDYGREIPRLMHESDLVVCLTPVTFGSYSYHLKKALERKLPLNTAFFKKSKGKRYNQPRYKSIPSFFGIGVTEESDEQEQRIFDDIIKRNGINSFAPYYGSIVLGRNRSTQEIREIIDTLLREVSDKHA